MSQAVELFSQLIQWIVETVGALGYWGIAGLMFLESSFFPFPSEVVMPPAGYLAAQGKMSLSLVFFFGILGSLLGALFNYWISAVWGRRFFDRWGKYFFVGPEALDKAEAYFSRHGHISTFIGRLIPVIRQYISLPAGVARMNLMRFFLYTSLGAGIWVVVLTMAGYLFGQEGAARIHGSLQKATLVLIVFCLLVVGFYLWHCKRKKRTPK